MGLSCIADRLTASAPVLAGPDACANAPGTQVPSANLSANLSYGSRRTFAKFDPMLRCEAYRLAALSAPDKLADFLRPNASRSFSTKALTSG